jgi:hypothetical protein
MFMEGPSTIVPVFGCLMIIAVVVGPVWVRGYFKSKEREQLHQTLRMAYEKGQPVPPELIERLTGDGDVFRATAGPQGDLRRAVVLIAVGLGLGGLGLALGYGISLADTTGGWITGGAIAGAGAIPGMIGLAYLLLWLGRRGEPRA